MAAFVQRLEGALASLSERERRLVLILAVTAVVLTFIGAIYFSQRAIDAKEQRVKLVREQLDQIVGLETQYKAAELKEKQAKARLKSNTVSLFSRLQKAAQTLGLSLKDLNERQVPVKDAEGVTEVTVEVNVKSLSIDKLVEFLKEIEGETKDGLVKVVKLKVKTRHDNDELLDVNMTVATWKQG